MDLKVRWFRKTRTPNGLYAGGRSTPLLGIKHLRLEQRFVWQNPTGFAQGIYAIISCFLMNSYVMFFLIELHYKDTIYADHFSQSQWLRRWPMSHVFLKIWLSFSRDRRSGTLNITALLQFWSLLRNLDDTESTNRLARQDRARRDLMVDQQDGRMAPLWWWLPPLMSAG